MEFLLHPKNTPTPFFYEVPKIYKPNYTLRLNISGCDVSTDHFSTYIINFFQLLASNHPSHVKYKKHFVNLIEKLPLLSSNAFFVTADFI